MTQSSSSSVCFWKCDRNSRCQFLYIGFKPKLLIRWLYSYWHPPTMGAANAVQGMAASHSHSWQSWYFGSDDQRLHAPTLRLVILYFRIENHKVAPTLNLVMFVLNLAGTDITVRFKVFLWSYLWNLNWYTTPKNPYSVLQCGILQCGLCNVSQFFSAFVSS